ncbi:MAG: hypothetical protein EHM35_00840 [Planctomycetaceae bacterium]|nr:MAG: hypothetical protein EHM35_00840 [Planctomycetaceae bacterium]
MDGYEQYLEQPDQTDALGKISTLAEEMADLGQQIEAAEALVERLTKQRDEIAERRLPELFDQVGMKEFKTTQGVHLVKKDKVQHSVSKDRKAAAMKWLDEHGHGGMIKNTVVVAFNKGQEKEVADLRKTLEPKFENVRTDQEVASASLGALIRSLIEEGKEVPHDVFGIHEFSIVEIAK